MKTKTLTLMTLLAICLLTMVTVGPTLAANGDSVVINEIQVSTSGSDWEFFELQGDPETDLSDLTLVGIESDFGSSAGTIDLVVSLAGQVISRVVIGSFVFESRITQVCPQKCHHAQRVGMFEGPTDFLYLSARLLRTEVNRCPHGNRAQLEGLVNAGKQGLVVDVRVCQQCVVVELDQERDLVRVLAAH